MFNHDKKLSAALVLLIIVALVVSGCGTGGLGLAEETPTPVPTVVETGLVNVEGRIIPVRSSVLSFMVSGEIIEILVTEGQQVNEGDVLVRLGPREPLEASLNQAMLEQISAQQALDELNNTSNLQQSQLELEVLQAEQALSDATNALNDLDTTEFREELDDAIIAAQDALEDVDEAETELDKYQDLDPDNPTRQNAQDEYDEALDTYEQAVYERDTLQNRLDQAEASVVLAEARLADAYDRLESHQDGPDPDDLALAEARLEAANSQVSAAQQAFDNLELTAPYDGVVVELNDLDLGENVTPARNVVTIADFSAWMVETRDLNELDIVLVEPGQTAIVSPDAIPDLELEAVIESIDQVYTERSGEILFTVRLRLLDSDPLLRWGMTVTVVIE